MPQRRILVVDDEADIQALLRSHLERSGFEVAACGTGEEAVELAEKESFDAILLDLMLPGIDGFEVLKRLKLLPHGQATPVVVLSARTEDADVVTALELGAEDFIAKPFSLAVLVARLKTAIRRCSLSGNEDPPVISLPDIQIDPGRRKVVAGARCIALTNSEFTILQLMAQRPGWVFSRQQILKALRGNDDDSVHERSVDYLIAGLRRKLGPQAGRLETVRGFGYRIGSGEKTPEPASA
jgi:two-component system phosphate regulon response regulator PhoB